MNAATLAKDQILNYEIRPAPAALGAEVYGLDLRQLNDATFKRIHETWLHHLLLVFKNQTLTAEDLVNLVKRFGAPISSKGLHQRGLQERTANQLFNLPPEVTVVTNVRENGKPVGILGDGEIVWHSDFSFKERPTSARMLVAMEVPPQDKGGNTLFLNAYAAYDALPANYKKELSGKTIKQGNIVDTAMKLRPGASLQDDIRTAPGPSHPIISTHPDTGCNHLYLGRRHAAYVNGMTLEDSEAFLNRLWDYATQDRFVYTHRWNKGDVVVWDNRATVHKRDGFDPDSRRVLYAAQVEGHKPFEAADALSRPAHQRA